MNKKVVLIICLIVSIMVLTPTIGIASAGKGQEKMFFQIEVTTLNEPIPDRVIRCAPVWDTPPAFGGTANVVFVEIDYIATDLTVKVGTDTILPSDVTLSDGLVDVAVYWNVPVPFSKVHDKDEFTLDFSELFGTTAKIEVRRIGKSDQAAGTSSGTFVGHGTDFLKGVKVSGIQTDFSGSLMITSFQLTGTIMGWPGLP